MTYVSQPHKPVLIQSHNDFRQIYVNNIIHYHTIVSLDKTTSFHQEISWSQNVPQSKEIAFEFHYEIKLFIGHFLGCQIFCLHCNTFIEIDLNLQII